MSENNNQPKKKSGRASIATMDYGIGAGLGGGSSFGTGKAARNLLSGPLSNSEAKIVELNLIDSNPNQPRTYFDQIKLEELAADIKERGILQPPVIREVGGGRYEIVAGERRCRAARMAGLTEIPVIIKEFKNEQEIRLASLAENLQRDDLDIEDEARFLTILQKEMNLSMRKIAEVIHRSHLYVYRRLEIADEPELLELYRSGQAGIETLGKIAKIPKIDKIARDRAISALKLDKLDPKKEKTLNEGPDQWEETAAPVTLRNTLKPIGRVCLALPKLDVQRLSEKELQELGDAIAGLEDVIADFKRKFE